MSLNMKFSTVLRISPNRKNLFLVRKTRTDLYDGIDSYNKILIPIAKELKLLGKDYPQTIIYLKLQYCGHAYKLFQNIIKNIYLDNDKGVSSCLIAQFHAPQTNPMKKEIINELMKLNSNIRVIFASPALGMGVNMPYVTQIIHISPPSSLEEYTQAIGRAGRTGLQSTAILYFCNSDISQLKVEQKLATKEMVEYCKTKECLRKELLHYFGFYSSYQVHCCSNCNTNAKDNTKAKDVCSSASIKSKERSVTKENLEMLINSLNDYLANRDETALLEEEYFYDFNTFLGQRDTTNSLSDKCMVIVENIQNIFNVEDLIQYGILDETESQDIFSLIEKFSNCD